jgi:hypothetical protein
MSDLQNEMNHTVTGFVATITKLARRAAIESLELAFGDPAGLNGERTAVNGTRGAAHRHAAPRHAGRPSGVHSKKRTPAQMQALSERFTTFVKANPGLRIEQINRQLGTTTNDLALPIRKLVAEGVIQAKGEKRSTKYFAA